MEINFIAEQIREQVERLNVAQRVLYRQAKEKAETERVYRMELAQQIVLLRTEGHPVALVGDLARGSCASEKFDRDLAESQFKSTIEAIEAIKVNISALQSILRYQDEQ
jgi:hypothetical protein